MEIYLLFLVVASATILSPGPGVVYTLSNSMRYGPSESIAGIIGISIGTFIVAAFAATSLGLILATSALAFSAMKYIGAIYLVYLGIKLWRASALKINEGYTGKRNTKTIFIEGALIQILNPKAIFFFMSIFPQFVNHSAGYVGQFFILVTTYSILVILIHIGYALIAQSTRKWLSTPKGGRIINRAGGATFICFGIGLATANR